MLESVPTGHSIVIVGAWNPRIFSPLWVAAELTSAKQIDLAIAPSNPSLPLRLQFDGVYLHIGSEKIQISPAEPTDQALERMQSLALTILERLPHTPLVAVGVNFRFATQTPSQRLLSVFELSDNDSLAQLKAEVRQTTVKRSLTHNGIPLNLTLELRQPGSVAALFNFHRTSPTADAATKHLEYGLLNYRTVAGQILSGVYEGEGAHANV